MKICKTNSYIFFLILLAIVFFPATNYLLAQRKKEKEIYFSSPVFLKRKTALWEKQSRLVGTLKNTPPEFTIEIYSHSLGKVIKTMKLTDKISVYETPWLPAPGTYTFNFSAEGFSKCSIKSLKLAPFSDCLVNVEFGKVAYERNY